MDRQASSEIKSESRGSLEPLGFVVFVLYMFLIEIVDKRSPRAFGQPQNKEGAKHGVLHSRSTPVDSNAFQGLGNFNE